MCEDRKGSHSRLPRAAPADEERQNYCLRSINMLSQSLEQFNAQAVSSVARQKAPVRSASLPDFKNDRQRVSRAVVGGCTDGLQSCLACLGQLRTTRQYERTCPIDFDQSGALNFTYSYTMQVSADARRPFECRAGNTIVFDQGGCNHEKPAAKRF